MEINIVRSEKSEVELEIDNLTIAEVLRVYLNEAGAEFVAWKKNSPSKPIVFKIKTSGKTIKKAVSASVSAVKKDLDGVASVLKKK